MADNYLPNLDEKPSVLLWSVSQLWQRRRKASLKAIDLTLAQYITLACLLWFSKKNQKITQVMLADRSKLDIMHTSRIVRDLEKKELLTRTQSPDDSRANYISITQKGEEIAMKGSEILDTATNQFFKPLQEREKEFVEIMKILMQSNDIPIKTTDTIELTRKLPASLEEVWDAWTKTDYIKQWMAPVGWTTPEASIDFRVGGHISIVMEGNPIEKIGSRTKVPFHGMYQIIDKPMKLVFTWDWENQQETQVTVLFKAISTAQAEITLIHTGFTNEQSVKEDTYAWTSTLNNLERFLKEKKERK